MILLLALQGGRLNFSTSSFYTSEIGDHSFALDRGAIVLPRIVDMEHDLADAVAVQLPECIGDFGILRAQWSNIYAEQPIVTSAIDEDTVRFSVQYPITLVDPDGTTRLRDFSANVPIRLGYGHNLLQNITQDFSQHPDWIDATLLSRMSNMVHISMVPQDSENYLLLIEDNHTIPFTIISAVRVTQNRVPKILLRDTNFSLTKGQVFRLQIPVEDEGSVLFTDDTTLFDIEPNGEIHFVPRVPGTEEVRIRATDVFGKFDEVTLTLRTEANP